MLSMLIADFKIIFDRDPAARNWLEVLLCYPGLQAIALHRIAHALYQLHLPLIPRLISHFSRFITGIEIHPGAKLGKGVCIDHGMGIVIGETAILGDYCLIYQGVTLGGTGKETGKRHPTLGNNVVIGAGAKVLGNLQLGDNVRVGAGSVVLRDVPSDCTVVGIPGRIVYRSGERVDPLEHGQLPDSQAQVIRVLLDRIEQLEQKVQTLSEQAEKTAMDAERSLPNYLERMINSRYPAQQDHHLVAVLSASPTQPSTPKHTSCSLKDKVIEEFLDGSAL
ncbi:MAG: serine O-acetyltransferase [Leptolyngbyaceae bacterium]|nr:serine O-acetyltransferase [Leptolyngbyaceae bacterium]